MPWSGEQTELTVAAPTPGNDVPTLSYCHSVVTTTRYHDSALHCVVTYRCGFPVRCRVAVPKTAKLAPAPVGSAILRRVPCIGVRKRRVNTAVTAHARINMHEIKQTPSNLPGPCACVWPLFGHRPTHHEDFVPAAGPKAGPAQVEAIEKGFCCLSTTILRPTRQRFPLLKVQIYSEASARVTSATGRRQ